MSLIFEEPTGVPPIYTDDKKLSQILRNFISNALKFTAKGEVRVTARLDDNGLVTFAVTDTGIGIAAEHLGEIFQDFVQVDAPIQKRLRGTGLGLSLSSKLAIVLGGDVARRPASLATGSTFSVTIPTEFNPGASRTARPRPAPARIRATCPMADSLRTASWSSTTTRRRATRPAGSSARRASPSRGRRPGARPSNARRRTRT